MAVSTAIHSYGATLYYATSSGGSYTAVAEVVDIKDDLSVGSTKVTNLTSPNAFHEYIPALGEGGETTFTLNYTRAQATTLFGYLRTVLYWKVILPNTDVYAFVGHISKFGLMIPDDDRITQDASIKVTGKPTLTAGS